MYIYFSTLVTLPESRRVLGIKLRRCCPPESPHPNHALPIQITATEKIMKKKPHFAYLQFVSE